MIHTKETEFELLWSSFNWFKELPNILIEYNSRIHRTIWMSRVDARSLMNNKILKARYLGKYLRTNLNQIGKPKYKVGDKVRISRLLKVFDKASREERWSRELYIIDKIQFTDPVTYLLRPLVRQIRIKDLKDEVIKGCFYEEELAIGHQPESHDIKT